MELLEREELSGVICDKKVEVKLKKIYKTVIRPTLTVSVGHYIEQSSKVCTRPR